MLYDYLIENYRPNEPILLSEVSIPNIKPNNLRQQFKKLSDSGKIKRYDDGVYFIPAASRLKKGSTLSPSIVAQYKYIRRNDDEIEGYYSGYTFANQLGISTQVPQTLEIVSNNTSKNCREVYIQKQRIILRKASTTITKENYLSLQLLDLLKNIDDYNDGSVEDVGGIIRDYMGRNGLSTKMMEQYMDQYPDKVFRAIYQMRLYLVQ